MLSIFPSRSRRRGAAVLRLAAGLLACGGALLAGPLPASAQAAAPQPSAAPIPAAPAPALVARPAGLTLSQALAAARENSDVQQARQELAGARADVLSADHAPLPNLVTKAASIDLQHGPGPGNVFTRKRIDKSIGIDWTWERGGKRALR